MTPYFTETTVADGLEKHPFQVFLNDFFEKDLEPLVSLGEIKSEKAVEEAESRFPQQVEALLIKLGITDLDQRTALMKNDSFRELIFSEASKELEKSESVNKGLNKLTYGNENKISKQLSYELSNECY